eukprot:gene50256-3890_t
MTVPHADREEIARLQARAGAAADTADFQHTRTDLAQQLQQGNHSHKTI